MWRGGRSGRDAVVTGTAASKGRSGGQSIEEEKPPPRQRAARKRRHHSTPFSRRSTIRRLDTLSMLFSGEPAEAIVGAAGQLVQLWRL